MTASMADCVGSAFTSRSEQQGIEQLSMFHSDN